MFKVSNKYKTISGVSSEGDIMLWNITSKKCIRGCRRIRSDTENPFTTQKIKGLEFVSKDTRLYLILTEDVHLLYHIFKGSFINYGNL